MPWPTSGMRSTSQLIMTMAVITGRLNYRWARARPQPSAAVVRATSPQAASPDPADALARQGLDVVGPRGAAGSRVFGTGDVLAPVYGRAGRGLACGCSRRQTRQPAAGRSRSNGATS